MSEPLRTLPPGAIEAVREAEPVLGLRMALELLRRLLASDPYHSVGRDNEFLEALADADIFVRAVYPAPEGEGCR